VSSRPAGIEAVKYLLPTQIFLNKLLLKSANQLSIFKKYTAVFHGFLWNMGKYFMRNLYYLLYNKHLIGM
jgi:hypothetical protein